MSEVKMHECDRDKEITALKMLLSYAAINASDLGLVRLHDAISDASLVADEEVENSRKRPVIVSRLN